MKRLHATQIAFIAILSVTSLFVLGSHSAFAADSIESITLSPSNKSYTVDKGQLVNDTITVLNDGDTPYSFTVYAAPYSVKDQAYTPDFITSAPRGDAYTWIQFSQTTWQLEPHQKVSIPFTMRVSATAAPGGHYGVIFAEVQPGGVSGGTSLSRKKRVGCIMYVTVNGDLKMTGHLSDTSIPWFQPSAPLHTSVSITNTGNGDFPADVSLKVSDLFGNVKYQSQNQYPILPDTTRKIDIDWRDSPWIGVYREEITTTFLGATEVKSGYVLILPRWMVFVILLVGLVYVADALHRRKKPVIKRHR